MSAGWSLSSATRMVCRRCPDGHAANAGVYLAWYRAAVQEVFLRCRLGLVLFLPTTQSPPFFALEWVWMICVEPPPLRPPKESPEGFVIRRAGGETRCYSLLERNSAAM